MAPEGGDPGDIISGVSIDDFKKLEASVEAQMKEMHDMMAQLLANKSLASPPLEVNASASKEKEGEETKDGSKDSPPKIDGGKAEYNAVPLIYSPDPPIPHPHINNRGESPKLIPSHFSNWNFLCDLMSRVPRSSYGESLRLGSRPWTQAT